MAQQILQHITSNNLFPEFQPAYRSFHSTETALMRVCNDILLHMNKQHVVLRVFLDLSAAFDTVDHDVLLHRLEHRFGILDSALSWVRSYLTNRTQRIVIGNGKSSRFDLNCGVPQGSCLGPLLFYIYTSELFTTIKQHLPTVHCYTDDSQMYLAFKPDDSIAQNNAIVAMEECLPEIRQWMIRDRLLINDDKTEFALIGTNAQLRKVSINTLRIGDAEVHSSIDPIRNLGVWIDNTFSMKPHVINTCKGAFFHLHNIRRIRKYLSRDSTEKLIHAFVSSRLDYCNGLLYGLPEKLISKLQRVPTTVARIVYCMPTFCHITPLLFDLHWLPVKFRIDYKIIITTFKCLHNTAPHYLSSLLSVQMNSEYGLRSTFQTQL